MNQVTIIGNGFDIACGLKSTYADYFAHMMNGIEPGTYPDGWWKHDEPEAFPIVAEHVKAKDPKIFSAWVPIFAWLHDYPQSRSVDKLTWCDVESAIRDFVTGLHSMDTVTMIDCYDRDISVGSQVSQAYECLCQYFDYADCRPYDDASKAWTIGWDAQGHVNLPYHDFARLFLRELERFEKNFREYIGSLVTDEYLGTAESLYTAIDNANTSADEIANRHLVLNFNFTDPLARVLYKTECGNVHGTCKDGTAFFGFAPKNDDPAWSDAYMFAKHVRYLEVMDGYKAGCSEFWKTLNNLDHIDVIKVFGCSLEGGKDNADYPYFRHIFRKAHLEDGGTYLGFYYTEGASRERLLANAVKLLNGYGEDVEASGGQPIQEGLARRLEICGQLGIGDLTDKVSR
ncbi:AbiH family protein [Bifidobacterium leontopitheci]|uniref:Bacteriophage abortive infection AbiH n=1 Tax=Bifidobacterium leontopitheci TaxID=2650774 RepID=A0A6I1GHD0_9BIFI|nr:AbiH family protein [Bifidobacterium leontopitheci]KAB7791035.1 Bacteriophage abortive infection AbiH [Bifidobacterium leontopitheci]